MAHVAETPLSSPHSPPESAAPAPPAEPARGGKRSGAGRKPGRKESGAGKGEDPPLNPKLKELSNEDFWRAVDAANWGSDDKGGTAMAYLYRLHPLIDRRLTNHKHAYIEKISEPFDLDHVRDLHGGGRYRISLTDNSRPKHQTEVARTRLKIDWVEVPPVIDLAELMIGHDDNRAFEEYLRRRNMHPEQGQAGLQAQAASSVRELADIVRSLIPLAIDQRRLANPAEASSIELLTHSYKTALDQAVKKDDPGALFDLALKMKDLLAPAAAPTAQSDGLLTALLPALIQMMTAQAQAAQAQNQSLLKMLLDASKPGASALSQIKDLAGAAAALRELGSMGSAEPGDPKDVLWSELAKSIPQVVGVLPAILGSFRAPAPAAAPGLTAPPPPSPGAAIRTSRGIAPPGAPEASGDNPALPPPGASVSEAPPMSGHEQQIILTIASHVVSALNRDRSGADFAEAFESMYGRVAYEQVVTLGTEGIVARLRAVPQAWQMLAPYEAMLGPFIEEFVTAFDEEPESAPAPPLVRPPAPAAPIARKSPSKTSAPKKDPE